MLFDLSTLAKANERWARRRRSTYRWSTAMMGFCGLVGFYLLIFRHAWSASTFYIAPTELLGMGLVIGGLLWRKSKAFGPSPWELEVTPEFAAFGAASGGTPFKISWDDPRLSLTLYDFRSLGKTHGIAGTRDVDLLVEPKGRAQTPVPIEAFEVILRQAERHGLAVKHRMVPAGRLGIWDRISIEPSRL